MPGTNAMFDQDSRLTIAVVAGLTVALAMPSFAYAGAGETAKWLELEGSTLVDNRLEALSESTNQSAPLRASLQVDVAALGAKGKPLGTQVQSRADAMLRELEFLPAREANDLLVLVKISGLTSDPGYVIDFSGLRGGLTLENPVTRAECRLCTDGETVDLFATRLREYLDHARTTLEQANTKEPAHAEPGPAKVDLAPKVQVEVKDRAEVPVEKARPGVGTMGWVGIGVGAAGLLAVGGGVGMMVAGPYNNGRINFDTTGDFTDLRPAGIAVVSAGAVALIAGTVLFILDRKKSRSRVAK